MLVTYICIQGVIIAYLLEGSCWSICGQWLAHTFATNSDSEILALFSTWTKFSHVGIGSFWLSQTFSISRRHSLGSFLYCDLMPSRVPLLILRKLPKMNHFCLIEYSALRTSAKSFTVSLSADDTRTLSQHIVMHQSLQCAKLYKHIAVPCCPLNPMNFIVQNRSCCWSSGMCVQYWKQNNWLILVAISNKSSQY